LEELFVELRENGIVDTTRTWGLVKVGNLEELDKTGYTELTFEEFQMDWCCNCTLCQEKRGWSYNPEVVKKKLKLLLEALGYKYIETVYVPTEPKPAMIVFGDNYVVLIAPRFWK